MIKYKLIVFDRLNCELVKTLYFARLDDCLFFIKADIDFNFLYEIEEVDCFVNS